MWAILWFGVSATESSGSIYNSSLVQRERGVNTYECSLNHSGLLIKGISSYDHFLVVAFVASQFGFILKENGLRI